MQIFKELNRQVELNWIKIGFVVNLFKFCLANVLRKGLDVWLKVYLTKGTIHIWWVLVCNVVALLSNKRIIDQQLPKKKRQNE